MTSDFIRTKILDTETYTERIQSGDEDRGRDEASTSQEKTRLLANRGKPGEQPGADPSLSPQRKPTFQPLDLVLPASRTEIMHLC